MLRGAEGPRTAFAQRSRYPVSKSPAASNSIIQREIQPAPRRIHRETAPRSGRVFSMKPRAVEYVLNLGLSLGGLASIFRTIRNAFAEEIRRSRPSPPSAGARTAYRIKTIATTMETPPTRQAFSSQYATVSAANPAREKIAGLQFKPNRHPVISGCSRSVPNSPVHGRIEEAHTRQLRPVAAAPPFSQSPRITKVNISDDASRRARPRAFLSPVCCAVQGPPRSTRPRLRR